MFGVGGALNSRRAVGKFIVSCQFKNCDDGFC